MEFEDLYSLISDALVACDEGQYNANKLGAYRVEQKLRKAFALLDEAERDFYDDRAESRGY